MENLISQSKTFTVAMNNAMRGGSFSLLLFLSTLVSAQQVEMLTLQPGAEEGIDAWVWSGERTKEANFGIAQSYNQGLHNVVRAEVWKWFGQTESDTIRSFLRFDLSAIPSSATVIEAKLSLYYFSNPGFTPQLGENEMQIVMVDEQWEEGTINWLNQPKVRNDFIVETHRSSDMYQHYEDIDIRSIVQEMVYFRDRNHGIRLSLLQEKPYNGVTFASSDHEDAQLRPKLVVKYQVSR